MRDRSNETTRSSESKDEMIISSDFLLVAWLSLISMSQMIECSTKGGKSGSSSIGSGGVSGNGVSVIKYPARYPINRNLNPALNTMLNSDFMDKGKTSNPIRLERERDQIICRLNKKIYI